MYGVHSKIKLLDFWSPACGPWFVAMPDLVKVYREFHEKGLEVISICLGGDQVLLKRLAEKYNMPWICLAQIEEKDSDVGALYAITTWPTLILTDADNNILSTTNFSVSALRDKLDELLAE